MFMVLLLWLFSYGVRPRCNAYFSAEVLDAFEQIRRQCGAGQVHALILLQMHDGANAPHAGKVKQQFVGRDTHDFVVVPEFHRLDFFIFCSLAGPCCIE
jgi:hypothetical protein